MTVRRTIFTIMKRLCLIVLVSFLVIVIGIIAVVEKWATTDQGHLPPKTAVILYAINHNLVTLDMTPPRWLTHSSQPSSISKNDTLISVSDGSQIPVRIYTPRGEGPFPIILYYHGGAFLEGLGSIETHDNVARTLASQTNSIVISVGYRLAPTYMFPTAIEDSYDALVWAKENASRINGDITKMAVAGDSAGGNIATVVAMMSRDRHGPDLKAQVLFYPVTTFLDEPWPSREQYADGYYLLSSEVMALARNLYAPDQQMWTSPYTSPLHAADLSGLPPAFIITAEFDPLRDEGEAYAKRLAESGTPVYAVRYQGVMHGFISFHEVMYSGKHGLILSSTFLNRAFADQLELPSDQLAFIEPTFNIRDYVEAYAFAAYLLSQKGLNWFQNE